MSEKINTAFVLAAIQRYHQPPEWVFATEVRTTTGYTETRSEQGTEAIRRIDAFAMSCYPSSGYKRISYEIKLSRSDWLAELNTPEKRLEAFWLCDQFVFVVGPRVYQPGDVIRCMDCTIMEINEDGQLTMRWRGRRQRESWPMPLGFIASFVRKVYQEALGDEQSEALARM